MLFKSTLVAAVLALTALVAAAPVNERRADGPGHPYTCDPKYKAASRKQHLLSMGANARGISTVLILPLHSGLAHLSFSANIL